MQAGPTRKCGRSGAATAFTLMEMLIVIGIIGILAAMTAPTLKSLGRSDIMGNALRQLVDDLNLARLRAINGRTTVYVVFFPQAGTNGSATLASGVVRSNVVFFQTNLAANRLMGGQLASYAMYAARTLGDQPGRPTAHYLSEWKTLPKGVYFDTNIFYNTNIFWNAIGVSNQFQQPVMVPNDNPATPFPANLRVDLPYIAFDSQGRLVGHTNDVILPVMLGSLVYQTDPPQYTNYSLLDPARVIEKADRGLALPATGAVRAGVSYVVMEVGNTGLAGSIRYNGTTYFAGQTFTGAAGVPNFMVTGTAEVREVNGVVINWLTGRARQRRVDAL